MCGICGIVSKNNNIDFEIIRRMNDALSHRGPDDEGFLSYNSESGKIKEVRKNDLNSPDSGMNEFNLYAGHRRLSIIDTSDSGHQPFRDQSGKYYLIYNGEIYNYIELKKTLTDKGYKFSSHTDTEVLLYMYIEYGENCLQYLNGMWSFVILDTDKNILFGSRDRFGVKPFYYFFDRNFFIFSSEIKSLIQAPQIRREINEGAAFDYLTIGRMTDTQSTVFKNVIELKPSSYFTLNLNNFALDIRGYYKLDFNEDWENFDESKSESYISGIRNRIFDAVDLRLRSDVKVGTCLSGGVDSSSIVCVINSLLSDHKIEQVGDLQKVFTSAYPDTAIDETNWASMVVNTTKSEWFRTFPKSNELLEDLEKLVYAQDVPFGSTTIYSQYRVMKLASENGIKVLLDGQGGDELFTGYVYFLRPFYNEMIKNKDISSLINEFRNTDNSPVSKKELIKGMLMSFAKLSLPISLKRKLFDLKVKENSYLNRDFYAEHLSRLESGRFIEHTGLNHALYEQFTKTSLTELLKYEDRNSMNFSIEARTPFADDINLIEYVFGIPSSYKIRNGWTKYLLRESMKGIIPEPIRQRTDKLGFATPEYHWLNDIKGDLKDYFNSGLDPYFSASDILKNWDTVFTNQSKSGFTEIWRFINFAIWKKVYNL